MTRGRKPASIVTGTAPATAVPKPPAWLSKDAKAEWRRVVPSLVERRVLDAADHGSLENYCLCMARVREIERELRASGTIDPALCRAQDKAITTARHLAALFGLTPSDRSRPAVHDGAADGGLDFLA